MQVIRQADNKGKGWKKTEGCGINECVNSAEWIYSFPVTVRHRFSGQA